MYEHYYEYALKTGGHRIGFFVTGTKVLNTLLSLDYYYSKKSIFG